MYSEQNPFQTPTAQLDHDPNNANGFNPNGNTVSAGQGFSWLVQAWRIFFKNPFILVGMFITFTAIIFISQLISPIVTFLIIFLGTPIFKGGLMLGLKAEGTGEGLRFSHIFSGFHNHAGQLITLALLQAALLFALALLYGLCVVIFFGTTALSLNNLTPEGLLAILVMFWGIMLVGLLLYIPVIMASWFAPALIVLHDLSPIQAMKASFYASLKNILPFLVYGLTWIVGIFALFILQLLLTIVVSAIFKNISVVVAPILAGLVMLLVVVPATLSVLYASIYTSYRNIFTQSE